ncbi:MAG: hypothetical protein R3E12_10160 [Candidatus Eisenbacteria bacterium]
MEFVEDDRADPGDLGVVEEPTEQHALGDEEDPRLRRPPTLEAHLVAHLLADVASALGGDPAAGETGGDPARLQHHHHLFGRNDRGEAACRRVSTVDQDRRDPRGLSGPGFGLDEQAGALPECLIDRGEKRVDRQGRA